MPSNGTHRSVLFLAAAVSLGFADGPADNQPDKVRLIPPPGIELLAADRAELEAGVAQLAKAIDSLRGSLSSKPALLELLPDVQIYHNAVRYALQYNEFFDPKEVPVAKSMIKQGLDRAAQLGEGKAPWNMATGLVARGYVSKIDGSVQPYGLVVPATYRPDAPFRHRIDLWFHGRGEKLSELNFIDGRQKSPGEFTPANTFVLHPYGRYCNANKFAGEVDTFEALDHVRKHYPIDENRVVVRGFSMGGAACWQFAVHYASQWAAAAPGAGFSETPDFLKVFQNEELQPTWYERKLWHLYDCTDYAVNLFNCPTVAYSGEIDKQKQAADMMADAMKAEGIELVHVIGPKTGHSYHPQAKAEISRRIDAIAALGRPSIPSRVRFATWTLRYNQMHWLQVDGLERHWERARVDAEILNGRVVAQTENVTALSFAMPPGRCPLDNTRPPRVQLDSQELAAAPVLSDRSWTSHFRKIDGRWSLVDSPDDGSLRKRPGLQGPIDDAFMDSFIMVRPTGKPLNEKVGRWVAREMTHAIDHWRRQFRGEARAKNDTEIADDDIASSNLVLWGDPSSNKVLAKIADTLPIGWTAASLSVGTDKYAAGHHAPVLIYPNPLNPNRYIVVNSGFTYREYDYLNNARQVPKLPDWAVVNLNTPPSSRWPGEIVAAGFFDEAWQLRQDAPNP
jgi:pimeloyl-ACP methyl ester carboxylesterase